MDQRRAGYLRALGIQAFEARFTGEEPIEDVPAEPAGESEALPVAEPRPEAPLAAEPAPAMPSAAPPAAVAASVPEIPSAPALPDDDVAQLDWAALRERVASCRACALCEGRTQTVFGTGANDADWLIVGEAPGAEEDRQGEPFVGRAGLLLNAMLKAIGRERQSVYIANILKCRPPRNRDPKIEEALCCRPYLDRQIALLKPSLIIAVGRIAAHRLLDTDAPLGRLRGQVHHYGKTSPIPLVVTYHPAYLLRTPGQKRKAWEDLLFAHKVAGGSVH